MYEETEKDAPGIMSVSEDGKRWVGHCPGCCGVCTDNKHICPRSEGHTVIDSNTKDMLEK